jgi:hypothetical protein
MFQGVIRNENIRAGIRHIFRRREYRNTSGSGFGSRHRIYFNTEPLAAFQPGKKKSPSAAEIDHGVTRLDKLLEFDSVGYPAEHADALLPSKIGLIIMAGTQIATHRYSLRVLCYFQGLAGLPRSAVASLSMSGIDLAERYP